MVGSKRHIQNPFRGGHATGCIDHRHIGLLHRPLFELALQFSLHASGFGEDHQTGGVLVEAMDLKDLPAGRAAGREPFLE